MGALCSKWSIPPPSLSTGRGRRCNATHQNFLRCSWHMFHMGVLKWKKFHSVSMQCFEVDPMKSIARMAKLLSLPKEECPETSKISVSHARSPLTPLTFLVYPQIVTFQLWKIFTRTGHLHNEEANTMSLSCALLQ
eukprot:6469848-Amphidinium_carterae.2